MAPKQKKKKVPPIPKGYATVTATMNQADAKATIAFCKKAFGAKVAIRVAAPGGKIQHAEMRIGDSIVMISDAIREAPRVASMFLYVPDARKTFAKAVKAGATVMVPLADMPWGDRYGRLVDPFGNLWVVATHIEDLSPAEAKKRQKAVAKQLTTGSAG